MVLFNYAIREITAKIVYYGPGLCGKTTNLQFIHERLDEGARGKLLSLATDGDRTLFFDFLPIEMGSIGGYKVRFQLYTVPGQVHYNATRKLVLKGVDAVVFVADSQLSMLERNRESFENLVANLVENGYDPARIPVVVQLNKRDLPNVAGVGELVAAMRAEGLPLVEAVACRGDGVFETLKEVVRLTLSKLRTQFDTGSAAGAEQPAAPPPSPSPPPPAPGSAFATAEPEAPPPEPPPPEMPAVVAAPQPLVSPPAPAASEAAEAAEAAPEEPDAANVPSAEQPDMYEEFDLEELSGGDLGDLESGREFSAGGGPGALEEMTGGDGGFGPIAERSFIDEGRGPGPSTDEIWPAATSSSGMFAPASGSSAGEQPRWAVELMEELQRLRAENRELREALRCLAATLGRQIDVLRDGREELERHVGDGTGRDAA